MSVIARNNLARLVFVTSMAALLFCLSFASAAYAAPGDVGENLKDLAMSWIEPIFYVVMAAVAVVLFFKRKFPELLGFLALAAVVAGIIFNPEGTKDLLVGISNRVSGDK